MKRNLLLGITFITAIALSSCSVNKTASNAKNDDDVYFSRATAAEEPVYITRNDQYNQDGDDQYSDDDDYFYYDDYASRINRFSYYSPFGYYDNFYSPYGYGGYGNGWNVGLGLGYDGYGYGGWGGGFGLGWGGGYGWGSPWGYGYGSPFGYGGFYSPYSFWGGGYGYGWGGGYWGGYSAYRSNPRPYRGNGAPGSTSTFGNRSGYNNSGIGYIPGGRQARSGVAGVRPTNGGQYNNRQSTRQQRQPQNYQPSVERSAPSSFGGGGGGRSSGGGGGGGRPVRN